MNTITRTREAKRSIETEVIKQERRLHRLAIQYPNCNFGQCDALSPPRQFFYSRRRLLFLSLLVIGPVVKDKVQLLIKIMDKIQQMKT